MSYSGRRRYKNRREKYETTKRNARLILLFASVAGLVLLYKNRWAIYDWLHTFSY